MSALRAISAATQTFAETTTDYERLLERIVHAVAGLVPDTCVITLVDESGTLTNVAAWDDDPRVVELFAATLNKPRARVPSATVEQADAGTRFVPEFSTDQIVGRTAPENVELLAAVGVRGMIVIPMRSRGGLLGLLTVMRHRADRPKLDAIDREIAEHMASHAALALGHAKVLRELVHSEDLRASEARAAEANRFVDAILENIPDMVFVKDAIELSFVRFNRAGEQLLGIPRSELVGKSDRDFFPRDEADFFIAKDRETLNGRKLVEIAEEPIQTRSGLRWLNTKKVPIVDAAGVPRFLLGISHDITDAKAAVTALAAANRELEAFSYSVAHDLRAPLRAIDGFAQALLEDYAPNLDEIGQHHLARIRAAAQRMALLIDELLRLSRVSRGEPQRERVDLATLARETAANLERSFPDHAVELVIDGALEAHADPKLLGIALDNLLANAWKFTSHTDHARVELGTRRDGSARVFFVRDNGAGFDPTYAPKLFGVFQRLHSSNEFAGTGIGLATVKRIIERHGGRVWAEGAVGRGATFYFTLEPS